MMNRPMFPPMFRSYNNNYYNRNMNNAYRYNNYSNPNNNIHTTKNDNIDYDKNNVTATDTSYDANEDRGKEKKKLFGIEFPLNIFGFEIDLDDIIIIGLILFLVFCDLNDDSK